MICTVQRERVMHDFVGSAECELKKLFILDLNCKMQ